MVESNTEEWMAHQGRAIGEIKRVLREKLGTDGWEPTFNWQQHSTSWAVEWTKHRPRIPGRRGVWELSEVWLHVNEDGAVTNGQIRLEPLFGDQRPSSGTVMLLPSGLSVEEAKRELERQLLAWLTHKYIDVVLDS